MSEPEEEDRDDRVLAGEYALGLLRPDEARAFEARLAGEPALRALYAGWAEDFVALTDDIPGTAPSPRVWRSVEAELFPATRPRRRLVGLLGYLLGGVAAALVAFLVMTQLELNEPAPSLRAEIAAEDQSLVIRAAYLARSNELVVDREQGGARPGRALELWLIEGDNPPVSLGVLSDTEATVLQVDAAVAAALPGGVLAVSDEPPGGSPTGQPTGDVLATGQVEET
ncbi:hypothetical protein E0K89_022695 [Aquicoccus sp. SCR17]|nr:hypothetical protein [Carideicomes alvinocaridis]